MVTKKSMWVLSNILVISVWVLGSAIQARAEKMNYKSYVWMNKQEAVSVDDVEGHNDLIKESGPAAFYECKREFLDSRASGSPTPIVAPPIPIYRIPKFGKWEQVFPTHDLPIESYDLRTAWPIQGRRPILYSYKSRPLPCIKTPVISAFGTFPHVFQKE